MIYGDVIMARNSDLTPKRFAELIHSEENMNPKEGKIFWC